MEHSFVNPKPTRLTDADFSAVAASIGLEAIHLKTIASVESKGAGYLPDGRPKILLEAKWFHNLTNGRFDISHPDISSPTWNKALYKGGPAEYCRRERAMALDPNAALQSASYGVFQIMGFNFKICGYPTVEAYVADTVSGGEQAHLRALAGYIRSKNLQAAFRTKN